MARPVPAAPLLGVPRRGFRQLILLIGVESFANSMAGNFWLVFLVEPPSSLPFAEAIALYLLMYVVAVAAVVLYARRRTHHATRSMTVGLVLLVIGHASFAVLPPLAIVLVSAVVWGVYFPTFWLPLNVLLVRETRAVNRAGRLALVTATFTTVAIVAPAVGGAIAELAGYRVLFAIAAFVAASDILIVRYLEQRDDLIEFSLDLRRLGPRTTLAFSGQGAVEGLAGAATPLAAFLFTSVALNLGLLFAFFSLLAGTAVWILGRASDRVRRRSPFLLLGPLLSLPACLVAATSRDLGTFAVSVGVLSMTTNVAPSFIYTIIVDRAEAAIPEVTVTREFYLNVSRSIATAIAIGLLLVAGSDSAIYALYLLVALAVLFEAVAK